MTALSALAVASVQRIAVRCYAYQGDALVSELSIAGGSVTADARRTVQRDCTLEIAPASGLTLAQAYTILRTPGVELAVWRGFVESNGAETLAPLGRFVPDAPAYRVGPAGETLTVSGSDVAIKVQRARWTDPYTAAAGSTLAATLVDLLQDRYPLVRTAISASSCPEMILTAIVTEAGDGSDPWADACSIAAAFGYTLYADPTGVMVVRNVAAPSAGAPVFTFSRGSTAILTESVRESTLDRTYNGVIATGEGTGTDTPVRGEAWDLNPASPTYRYGPFGQVPYFYSSPLMTSADQCESAATRILSGLTGRAEVLQWSSVVHPGLQPLDVVAVQDSAGATTNYVLDALTFPLAAAGAMTATAREVA